MPREIDLEQALGLAQQIQPTSLEAALGGTGLLGIASASAGQRAKKKRASLLELARRMGLPEGAEPETMQELLQLAQAKAAGERPQIAESAREAAAVRAAEAEANRERRFAEMQAGIESRFKRGLEEKQRPVSARNQQVAIESAEALIKDVEDQFNALVPPSQTGVVRGITRGLTGTAAQLTSGAVAPAIKSYEDIRAGFRPSLKETVGDSGVLTNQDIANIDKLLPTIGADPRAAAANFKTIKNIIAMRKAAIKRQFPGIRQEVAREQPGGGQLADAIKTDFKAGKITREEAKRRLKAIGF